MSATKEPKMATNDHILDVMFGQCINLIVLKFERNRVLVFGSFVNIS